MRPSLGYSLARLVCQFVAEGAVLVAGGLLAGLALADVLMQILRRLISAQMMAAMPYLRGLGVHPRVAVRVDSGSARLDIVLGHVDFPSIVF